MVPYMTSSPEMQLPRPDQIPLGELADGSGVVITEVGLDRMVATMPVAGNRQPYGLLHGGASAMLAETLGSIHAFLLAGAAAVTVGVELSCTHHRAARDGIVTAVSTPLHVGRTMKTLHIAITDGDGRPVCTARLTCMTRTTADPGRDVMAATPTGAPDELATTR